MEDEETRGREKREERCGEEIVYNNLWYKSKSIFHANGEGLTSDDPFFSRAQPYA